MPRVYLPSQLRELTSGREILDLPGTSVDGVLAEMVRRFPKTDGWVTDETGALRRHVKIFVNGEQSSLAHPLSEGDEVRILPAISGGDR